MFMKNPANRKEILQNAKKIRDSEYEHTNTKVFINPDQTKKQQLDSKNLRLELKARKLANPGKVFKIKRGVITEIIETIEETA